MPWIISGFSKPGKSDWTYQDRWIKSVCGDGYGIAVCDGHGRSDDAVDYAVRAFGELLPAVTDETPRKMETSMLAAFASIADGTRESEGGACCIALRLWNDGSVCAAVLGDSTFIAYLGRESDMLYYGPHHDLERNPVERRRAVERGGIYANGYICARYACTTSGRAFGDVELGAVLSKTPAVLPFWLGPGGWIVALTDGVVDPASPSYRGQGYTIKRMVSDGAGAEDIVELLGRDDDATAVLCKIA